MEALVTPWVTIVGLVVSIAISVFSAWASLKKTSSEVEVNQIERQRTNAEIVSIYAEELRKIKEDQIRDQATNQAKMDELKKQLALLNSKLDEETKEHEEERKVYRGFINELLLGITKLTGQIQIKGETPVWLPPDIKNLDGGLG